MIKLTIFDDNIKIANITFINNEVLIFAISSTYWNFIYQISQNILYKNNKINVSHTRYIDLFVEQIQSFNFNTELIYNYQ